MEEVPEADEFVTPYQLCDICKSLVGACTKKELWDDGCEYTSDDGHVEYPLWQELPPLDTPWPSYATLAQLRQSADDGCHLCSIFANQPTFGKNSDSQLAITPSRIGYVNNRRCQTLDINFTKICKYDSFLQELGTPTTLHRHVCDGTANVCTVERKGQPDGSLESRYRWCKNTGSHIGFGVLKVWLQHCVGQHEHCGWKLSETRPMRLLDLNAFPASKNIRLVLAKDVSDKDYATLSYRWGDTNIFTLTTANYKSLCSQIQFEDLPKTIQDAIMVCRELWMRYVWVDALCIIQENGQDFAHEVTNMGAIYANSLFTIAAADSADSDSGCFWDRNSLRWENYVLVESDKIRWVFEGQNSCTTEHEHTNHTPLSTRGWVLQEQMLSPRTIHFTSRDIIWDCREQKFCQGCIGRESVNPGLQFTGKRAMSMLAEGQDVLEQELYLQTMWSDIVSRYSLTELTNFDDRLSALAGIAQLIEDKLHYEASYGLWLEFFVDQLRWHTFLPEGRIKEINEFTPSWSWASVQGGVGFDVRWSYQYQEVRTAEITRYPAATPFLQISVLYKQIPQPVSFMVRGWIKPCQVYPVSGFGMKNWWTLLPASEELPAAIEASLKTIWEAYLSNDTTEFERMEPIEFAQTSRSVYWPDAPTDCREDLYCLLLKRECCSGSIIDSGLILKQIDPEKAIYKRVGYFRETINQTMVYDYHQPSQILQNLSSESTAGTKCSEHIATELSDSCEAEAEQSGKKLEGTGASDDTTKPGALDDSETPSTPSQHADKYDPKDCETEMKLQELIKYLTFFNGTETEAEVEII
ncbi:hypothetical protein M3J09_012091 [Ascochyta lentis]